MWSRWHAVRSAISCAGRVGLLGVLLLLTTSACATLGARSAPAPPQLEIPEPPPRIISPVPTGTGERAEEAPDVAATPPEAPASADDAPTAAHAPDPAAPEPAAPAPSSPLNLAPADTASMTLEAVRTALAGTTTRLRQVNRTILTPRRRVQYDTIRQFLDQAAVALRAGNITFAHYLGEKAATLLRELPAE